MTALAEEIVRPHKRGPHRSLLRETLRVPGLDPAVVAAYRPQSARLAERIVARIAREVSGFSAAADPDVKAGIDAAITKAVELFVDTVAGAPTQGTEVLAFYRWLGQYEATVGHNLDAMQAAHHIATQESWEDLRRASVELGVPADVRGPLGDALIAYQNTLFEQALMGFMDVRTSAAREREEGRAELLVALIGGASVEHLQQLARRCSWTLPASIAVAVTTADAATTEVVATACQAVSGVRNGRLIIVADAGVAEDLAHAIASTTDHDVALSWGVAAEQVHDAARWAGRALDLVRDRVIEAPDDHVVRCKDHTSRLCLHADPALRQLADEAVLAPLIDQSPKRRVALAETMLLWLQTRDSAPALAARLGIHDQTVRHRLRRLRELFGARLSDPSQTTVLLIALESSITGWRRSLA